jgi:hypothetical protein
MKILNGLLFQFCLILITFIGQPVNAQQIHGQMPSADKVISDYLKAIGGKKRVAAIHDATYVWVSQVNGETVGRWTLQLRGPSGRRSEMDFGSGQLLSVANGRSAWVKGPSGDVRTLTGADGRISKLRAALDATHLIDYKQANIMARVAEVANTEVGPHYVIEFSMRNGASLRYLFDTKTKLLDEIQDPARKEHFFFGDYRVENGVMEPHRVQLNLGESEAAEVMDARVTTAIARKYQLDLQSVTHNSGIAENLFDPPRGTDPVDVLSLLREVSRNQDAVEQRVTEYSSVQKETDREIDSKGVIKKETVKVYEVFPLPHREPVMKLISENGVALSTDRAAKEEKRVQEEMEKAERNQEKDAEKDERRRAERRKKSGNDQDSDEWAISQFLKACEFVSPRHEQLQNRDTVVFDFRVKPGFKPANAQESLISKLVGVVWLDPVDKQVIRIEARLAEGFKIAGGLLVSLRPGAALVMEQTRMNEGVWLPRLAQFNLSVKVLLFGGADLNKTIEWSDYKHFSATVNGYKIEIH